MLITGASGAGKSTIRKAVAGALMPATVCVELRDVSRVPARPTLEWRQQATERLVQLALDLQTDGQHLLVSGDPVAPGEIVAAPSAPLLEGIAVCLLDLSPEAQTARLAARGDDPALLRHHRAFAEWMRDHAEDPRHNLHVVQAGGWDAMRWDRLFRPDLQWHVETIDTTNSPAEKVAAEVLSWCAQVLAGTAPTIRGVEDPPPDWSDPV
jgi:thymidylate kinase